MMYSYDNQWAEWGPGMGMWGNDWMWGVLALALPFILAVVLWSLVWKGLALWHASRRGQYWWFAILLVVNTFGILEIIYLFAVAKLRLKELFSTKEHHHEHAHL